MFKALHLSSLDIVAWISIFIAQSFLLAAVYRNCKNMKNIAFVILCEWTVLAQAISIGGLIAFGYEGYIGVHYISVALYCFNLCFIAKEILINVLAHTGYMPSTTKKRLALCLTLTYPVIIFAGAVWHLTSLSQIENAILTTEWIVRAGIAATLWVMIAFARRLQFYWRQDDWVITLGLVFYLTVSIVLGYINGTAPREVATTIRSISQFCYLATTLYWVVGLSLKVTGPAPITFETAKKMQARAAEMREQMKIDKSA